MGHMTLVPCGRSHSVTVASSVTQDSLFASFLRLVDTVEGVIVLGNANCQHAHCIHPLLHVLPFQIDSPALLANMLVNATKKTEEIESADVSLIVGLLSNVTNSPEDLQQEDVSGHSDCHCLSLYFHSQYHYTYCRCKRTFCQL